jgi:hypothetical protein
MISATVKKNSNGKIPTLAVGCFIKNTFLGGTDSFTKQ